MLGDGIPLLREPPLEFLELAATVRLRALGWIECVGNRLDLLDLLAEVRLSLLHLVQSTVDARH